jgi:hypothetical protein
MSNISEIDSINSAIASRIVQRAAVGHAKYGTTMDRNDLTDVEWMRHLQEELMDAVVYLEKLIKLAEGNALPPSSS